MASSRLRVDSNRSATTTYTFYSGSATGATQAAAAAAKSFAAAIGQLIPGAQSTLTFDVVVK